MRRFSTPMRSDMAPRYWWIRTLCLKDGRFSCRGLSSAWVRWAQPGCYGAGTRRGLPLLLHQMPEGWSSRIFPTSMRNESAQPMHQERQRTGRSPDWGCAVSQPENGRKRSVEKYRSMRSGKTVTIFAGQTL